MTDSIPIHIAVEDFLSEMVLRVMLEQSGRQFAVGACLGRTGFGYLKKKIASFNKAARGIPFIILADLDQTECPPILINKWLPVPKNNRHGHAHCLAGVEQGHLSSGCPLFQSG